MSQDPGHPENQGQQPPPPESWQDQPTQYNAAPDYGTGSSAAQNWGQQAQQPPAGGPGYGAPTGPPPGYGGPPPGYGGPGGPGGPAGPSAGLPPGKNFVGALFDFDFNFFATPVVVKVLYIIGMVVIGLGWLAAIVTGFIGNGLLGGILALVLGAVVALFYLILFRVTLEFYYAVVRMSEDIHHRRWP
ncbi:DUF4282 domain-containing protein [Pseudonocardia sp. N23]|uniref:DUF4282 domain-containing protein n=1 Tax=Pseudonocardia sp. N23 TaxID=1987376 RepID=UPI000BFBECC5|nr:DUF4282 domain-containing protein [Pseudonocardia sp. N23]GAY08931.1 hypothetical protein TOK_2887 [Pseudonocardia sp. N23]